MGPHWGPSGWQEAWRGALQPGGAARGCMRAIGSHLGALSQNVALPEHTWPRDSFMHTVETFRLVWCGLFLGLWCGRKVEARFLAAQLVVAAQPALH